MMRTMTMSRSNRDQTPRKAREEESNAGKECFSRRIIVNNGENRFQLARQFSASKRLRLYSRYRWIWKRVVHQQGSLLIVTQNVLGHAIGHSQGRCKCLWHSKEKTGSCWQMGAVSSRRHLLRCSHRCSSRWGPCSGWAENFMMDRGRSNAQ